MKILHTSDWHLLEKLGQVDRQPDIVARMEEIAGYLEQHQVDVMLISGDLFSAISRTEDVRRAVSDVGRIFRPFLLGGGTIVAISGNHDNEELIKLFREAMNLAAPLEPDIDAVKPSGRLYLFETANYLRLVDRAGQEVQFILLPYPTPGRYLKDDQLGYKTLDEKNTILRAELIRRLEYIKTSHLQHRVPAVLVSHLHVRGQQVHSLYHISESQDVVFDLADLPLEWAYIAFGHIHRPQLVQGDPHAQYAGSIERLDFAEQDDEKHVLLLDVGPAGLRGEPIPLPLNATPLYRVEISDIAQIDQLIERYPEHERAIVDYKVTYKPGESSPEAIREALEAIFPRWCRRKVEAEGSDLELGIGGSVAQPDNVPATVRSYLADSLADHPDRDDLLALAEELLATI